ncbi:nucleotidyltransferase domain-containing protein [Candidatus Bipolaricaulota bacterium]|nr:nucleotidyltransferase domain-containing protein [Candidatus Bipolaricaulota bacterium]
MTSRTPSGLAPSEMPNGILFEEALEACAHRTGLSAEAVLLQLEAGDRQMHSTFRYALAKGLSGYLASLGSVFHEVYVHGSAIGESANPTSDIDVIVVVERRRDEIANLLKRLDYSLTCNYRRLVGLKHSPSSLLDIQIVERNEQAERSGYGAVLDGLHTRPICLWRSDPANLGAFRKEGPQRSLHTVSSTVSTTSR